MLVITDYTVLPKILQEAQANLPKFDQRIALNQPMGKFFTDPWAIKPEFVGTVWETILASIAEPVGEARLIRLNSGEAYPSHADIDDRWHLSITGNHSYLIDLENEQMYTTQLGQWYLMDAGVRHTAINVGNEPRVQLVVRKLLLPSAIQTPINVVVTLKDVVSTRRFIFDDVISPWLNRAYKLGIVDNFAGEDLKATFTIEESHYNELKDLVSEHFNVEIV